MTTYTCLKYHIVFGTQYRKTSFADEYRALLIRHEIPFDEQYLFDDEHTG